MHFILKYYCTAGKKKKKRKKERKKKRNTRIYFNTNYCSEMKLVPVIMEYCLLDFDGLKFFKGASTREVSK